MGSMIGISERKLHEISSCGSNSFTVMSKSMPAVLVAVIAWHQYPDLPGINRGNVSYKPELISYAKGTNRQIESVIAGNVNTGAYTKPMDSGMYSPKRAKLLELMTAARNESSRLGDMLESFDDVNDVVHEWRGE